MLFLLVSVAASGLFNRGLPALSGIREILMARGLRPRLLGLDNSEKAKPSANTTAKQLRRGLNGTNVGETLLNETMQQRRLNRTAVDKRTVPTADAMNKTDKTTDNKTTVSYIGAINKTAKKPCNKTAIGRIGAINKTATEKGSDAKTSAELMAGKNGGRENEKSDTAGRTKKETAAVGDAPLQRYKEWHQLPMAPRFVPRILDLVSKILGITVVVAATGAILFIIRGVTSVRKKAGPNKKVVQADKPLLNRKQVYQL
jgi:hypothetical protein